jgi:hypothetical protein
MLCVRVSEHQKHNHIQYSLFDDDACPIYEQSSFKASRSVVVFSRDGDSACWKFVAHRAHQLHRDFQKLLICDHVCSAHAHHFAFG